MNDTNRALAPAEALQAELSALAMDTRCASILARVALETLAKGSHANRTRILSALSGEIAGQRLEGDGHTDAVVGLLNQVKAELESTTREVVYID